MEPHKNFLGIQYDTWVETVNTYFELPTKYKFNHLQLYPFTKNKMKDEIVSEAFYNSYIKSGYFITITNQMALNSNYLQKTDATYRQSQLLSPILYLITEAICKEIYLKVDDKFNSHFSLYAGNLEENDVNYTKQYDKFIKQVNIDADKYPYYMKFDFKDFYRNINLNKLFDIIENNTTNISPVHIYFYKQLIEYSGNNQFPIIENSVGLSYLATKIYLREFDKIIENYLLKELRVSGFTVRRYVDDFYVFFKPLDGTQIIKFFTDFKNFYNTEARKLNLTANDSKTKVSKSNEINQDLKKSFYEGEIFDEIINVHTKTTDLIKIYKSFLNNIVKLHEEKMISFSKYEQAIQEYFTIPDLEVLPQQVYYFIVYNLSENFINDKDIVDSLNVIIKNNILITYDVKRITSAVLNTRDGSLIKNMLRNLFKTVTWTDYENHVAVTYLLLRSFSHDHLKVRLNNSLTNQNLSLYYYIDNYCDVQVWINFKSENFIKYLNKWNISTTTMHLYFLYLKSKKDDDTIQSHAYFKTFFDRLTAELVYAFEFEKSSVTKPRYGEYYKEKQLKNVYGEFENGEKIIRDACKIRNSNPLVHDKAQLIKDSRSRDEILASIDDLGGLIKQLILKYQT